MDVHDSVLEQLEQNKIVALDDDDWERRRIHFDVLERHDTQLAGELLLVRGQFGLAAVEQPSRGRRVIRPLPSDDAARLFIEERLATYERMWDGCGCRIDYFR